MMRRRVEIDPKLFLTRRMNRIGRDVFVRHFHLFARLGRNAIDKPVVLEALLKDPDNRKEYDGCKSAVNAAYLIFRDHQEVDVMRLITRANSHILTTTMRLRAVAILRQLILEGK